jgi:hypothetical protein
MYQYQLWVRINQTQTTNTVVWAAGDSQARALGESMYGSGNVLNYTRIS